jgi:hypothetical protein
VTVNDIMGWLTTFDIASPLRALKNITFIFSRGGPPLASSILSNIMKEVIDRNLIVYKELDSDVVKSLSWHSARLSVTVILILASHEEDGCHLS